MNNLLNNINGWIANGPYGNDLMATSYSSGAVAAGDAAAESYASDTEHAIFIPEIWADAIDAAFKKKLILGLIYLLLV